MPQTLNTADLGIHLVILRSPRKMQYNKSQNTNVKTYPVAVGKPSTPTPTGVFKIVNKVINPSGILGTRWMGLSIPNGTYGIHGTNNPSSIGKFISNGCVRMYNSDVEELFPQINIGTPVIIKDSKNAALPDQKEISPPGSGIRYIVKHGDSLWKLSLAFSVPLEMIISANKLINPDMLVPGQVIIIPQTS